VWLLVELEVEDHALHVGGGASDAGIKGLASVTACSDIDVDCVTMSPLSFRNLFQCLITSGVGSFQKFSYSVISTQVIQFDYQLLNIGKL